MSPSIDEQILASSTSPHTFDMFHIMSNRSIGVKLELDMMFTLEQYKDMNTPAKKQFGKSSAIKSIANRWSSARLYYEITSSASKYRQVIYQAIDIYHKYTCITIIENKRAMNRVQFVNQDGCFSQVGMVGGTQLISFHPSCFKLSTVIHEIGHAVGFFHEHNRPDRDKYIYINESKMFSPHQKSQYKKDNISNVNTYNISYDYRSVMHYKGSHGLITTLDPDYQKIIGTAQSLSYKDIKLANLMYECDAKFGQCPHQRECPFEGFPFFKELNGIEKCACMCESGDKSNPLMPCVTIAVPPAGPIYFPVKSSSDPNKTECTDMRTDCAALKEKYGCSSNLRTMYTQCTKTCNFCGKGNNLCMDYEDGCHMMAGSGACKDEALNETMSEMCSKSCGLCKTSTPCHIENALF